MTELRDVIATHFPAALPSGHYSCPAFPVTTLPVCHWHSDNVGADAEQEWADHLAFIVDGWWDHA